MAGLAESAVEEAALAWLGDLGYRVLYGPDIAPGSLAAERGGYGEVVLGRRLREALARLNPAIPAEAREDAFRRVTRPESPVLITNNRTFHRRLVDGVAVEYRLPDGRIKGDRVLLVDFEQPENNDWLAVNQFTVVEGQHQRRPDVVVFVNGLPLGVIELKNPADEAATIWTAFNQLQTYKLQIPSLFAYNEILAVSDGLEARLGSLSAERERFHPWRTIEGEDLAPPTLCRLGGRPLQSLCPVRPPGRGPGHPG
jgi:type I restriction enzyme R subunit